MAALRFLAALFLLTAVIALVGDLTPRLDGTGHPPLTTISRLWSGFAPASLQAAKAWLTRVHPVLWDPMLASILDAPLFALSGGLALLLGYAGRKRSRIEVYTN